MTRAWPTRPLTGADARQTTSVLDPEPASVTLTLQPADNQRLASLCGQFDEHLRQLERRLHVEISNRGNQFRIIGADRAPHLAGEVLQSLYDATLEAPLTPERVHLHLQQAGLEVGQLRQVFRQVSESGRVLKLSNDQIAGTFNALIQIAGKGTLQMEELRQQLGDRIPGAVGIMANALGYGKDELAQFYKDVENGVVQADRALVFEDGHIIEQGHHEELIRGNGLYATLYRQVEGQETG